MFRGVQRRLVQFEFDLQKARSDALDELLDGFVLVDRDGTVLDTNPAGRALLAELGRREGPPPAFRRKVRSEADLAAIRPLLHGL